MHVFRDLGHVTAVGSLVKNDVDLVKRSADRFAVAQIALNKFRSIVNP
jgi:hypothetical protein